MRLSPIQRLARFPQAAREPVVDEGQFEHALEGLEHAHLRGARGCVGGDFDFVRGVGGLRGGGGGLFSFRLDGVGGLAGDFLGGGKGRESEKVCVLPFLDWIGF